MLVDRLLSLLPFVPLVLGLSWTALAAREAEARSGPTEALVVEGATLIDVETGRAVEGLDVRVEGDRIVAVAPREEVARGPSDRVIDGNGLYLLPGLFDAHVHYAAAPDLFGPMMVALGVTTARDAGSETQSILALRDALEKGERVGPRLFVTGAIVDGDPPVWPFSRACANADEARAAVSDLAEAGVDQIKVYSRLERDAWAAAVDEAHARGLLAVGHVPKGNSVEDALALGQDWIDHLSGFDVLIGAHAPGVAPKGGGEWSSFGYWKHLRDADADALRGVYERLAAAGTVVCPTLVVMEGIAQAADESARDPAMEPYVPAPLLAFWTSPRYRGMGASTRQAIPPMKEVVRDLHRAGVRLVVGTDLANPFVHAGFAVHREMALMQEAGVPAADVLRAATIEPARALRADDRLGSIAVGKAASFLLVRRNPLVDVRHASDLAGVVHRGAFLDRAALDGMLAEIRRRARPGVADEAKGAPDDDLLTPPGELVARGRLAITFAGFDAGSEEFALSRHDGGFRLLARSLPKGGFEQPFLVDLAYDGEGRFREGIFRQLTERPVVATYARGADGSIEAVARRAGDAMPPKTTAPAPDAIVEAPVFAGAVFSLHGLGLEVGQSRRVETVTFGRPTWEPLAAPAEVKRLDDADWSGAGRALVARRYSSVYDTPGGSMKVETWTDSEGLVVKAILTLPMGTLVAERVE